MSAHDVLTPAEISQLARRAAHWGACGICGLKTWVVVEERPELELCAMCRYLPGGLCRRVAFWARLGEVPAWAEEEVVRHVGECAACLRALEAGA